MSEESELEKRIRELDAENSRLKSKASRACEYNARENNYQGIPMLVFERPSGKPFKLVVSKIAGDPCLLSQGGGIPSPSWEQLRFGDAHG